MKSNSMFSISAVSVLLLLAGLIGPTSSPDPWQAMPGRAQDISVGADGSVFCVAPGPTAASDGIVYQWNEEAFGWMNVGGKAARVAVAANGTPWVLTVGQKIYRLRGATWQAMPGDARDIGAGADGSIWVVGETGKVYSWNDDAFAWEDRGGEARKIAVDAKGIPWVVTAGEKVYRLRGSTWQAMPGDAQDIGAGADGSVWVASPRGKVYLWNDDAFAWQDFGGQGVQALAVGPTGDVWAVTGEERIYWQPSKTASDSGM